MITAHSRNITHRAERQSALVYGYHAVAYLIQHKPDCIRHVYCIDKSKHQELAAAAQKHGLPVTFCNKKKFSDLLPGQDTLVHQGMMADCHQVYEQNINDLEDLVQHKQPPLRLLLLDGVTDPHNLGACLRNAAAFAVDALILPKDHSARLNATAIKIACGAAHIVPVMKVVNLVRTLDWLKTMDFEVIGTSELAEHSLADYRRSKTTSLALVMGAEGKGLRQRTRHHCDQLFSIPLPGLMQSLNVSAATAICLYHVTHASDLL